MNNRSIAHHDHLLNLLYLRVQLGSLLVHPLRGLFLHSWAQSIIEFIDLIIIFDRK